MRLALACVSAALAAAAAYPPGPITLKSVASNGLYVRHCAFYVTAVPVPANLTDDYLVEIVPGVPSWPFFVFVPSPFSLNFQYMYLKTRSHFIYAIQTKHKVVPLLCFERFCI